MAGQIVSIFYLSIYNYYPATFVIKEVKVKVIYVVAHFHREANIKIFFYKNKNKNTFFELVNQFFYLSQQIPCAKRLGYI